MKRKIIRSKPYRIIRRLLKTSTPESVVGDLIAQITFEKLLMILCNQCVFKSNTDINKKKRKIWYRTARSVHRTMDELKLEKAKKTVFRISRRDVYQCKCKKKFYVDASIDKNCVFDVDRGVVVVTCPYCGITEK